MMLCREVRPEELSKYEFPDYVCEIKWDGRRCMAHKRGNKLWLAGRDHPIAKGKYPEIENALLAIEGDFDIDGEIVHLKEVFIDAQTGKELTKDKLKGYKIIDKKI